MTQEVISGDSRRNTQTGVKHPFMQDFPSVNFTDIDRILNMPKLDDVAGILARSNFKSDEERIAYCRIIRRLMKFGLYSRLEYIRQCLSSSLGMRAFGKVLQLQAKTDLVAPSVMREQLNMKAEKQERTVRSSDFRREVEPKPMEREQ